MNSEEKIYTLLIYSANAADVQMTMIDGRVVMKDRELLTVDVREVLSESNIAIKRLLRRADITV